MNNPISVGNYVIFTSYRGGFSGRSLGKVVGITSILYRLSPKLKIKRCDNSNDIASYIRYIDDYDVIVLDTNDEFLARLQF